jgi:hypothetical protein
MAPESFVENEGLVGKLTDVKKGDRIRIWKETPGNSEETYEACGYMMQLEKRYVILSPNHPLHRPTLDARQNFSFGKRGYWLNHFTHYAKQKDEE